jgi:tetratricopeptide (TPR) repeat protein
LASNPSHVISLFGGELDKLDCPNCGATSSIEPSLAALFIVANELLLLNRGFDPEKEARQQIVPLVASLASAPTSRQLSTLPEFKDACASLAKATARQYPVTSLDQASLADKLANWPRLQGEILSLILTGATGIIPHFGVSSTTPKGEVANPAETVEGIKKMILDTVTFWATSLVGLTSNHSLDELLSRLIDSCGAIAQIAEPLLERLAAIREWIAQNDTDLGLRFHALAVEATIFWMLQRPNPNAADWAYQYLLARIRARRHGEDPAGYRKLSDWRLARTISLEHAWNAVAVVLSALLEGADEGNRSKDLSALITAADELGHPGLGAAVAQLGLVIRPGQGEAGFTPDGLAAFVFRFRAEYPSLTWQQLLKPWQLPWMSDADAVARFFDQLSTSVDTDPSGRAELLTWFGERMKVLGAPALGLARIGRHPGEWEAVLDKRAQRGLWTERSNLLRLAGEQEHALAVAQQALAVTINEPDASDGNKSVALQNVGILLRQNGRFSEALHYLEDAIRAAPPVRRGPALRSLATTYLQMGRLAEAADTLAAARAMLGGRDTGAERLSLLIAEASARFMLKPISKAETLVAEVPPPAELPDGTLVAYSNLLRIKWAQGDRSQELVALADETVARMIRRSLDLADREDFHEAQIVIHAAATVAQTFQFPATEALWRQDLEMSRAINRMPDTRTAIELTIAEITSHGRDVQRLSDNLQIILASLEEQFGGIALDSTTMDVLAPLEEAFGRLATLVHQMSFGPHADQRIAEIRRNAHRRAQSAASGKDRPLGDRVAAGAAMRVDQSPFLVVEWSDLTGRDVIGIRSVMKPGNAQAGYLAAPTLFDVFDLADRIRTRIAKWRVTRPDQPFEIEGWDDLRDWLRGLAASALPGGGHVVIIDHPGLVGLPYHIALAPEWTVSYSTGWAAIEDAIASNGHVPSSPRLGVLQAPRSNETPALRAALAFSADATTMLANRLGLLCDRAEPGTADANRLRGLLAETDVLKVLCHGQICKDDHEVVLLVDHEGRAPPGYSLSDVLATSGGHRFGRTALAGQRKSSRTVFLGACSAGIVSTGGLDERTSFSLLLADAGTAAVIAPRWEIDAALAFPILDEIMELFLSGMPLARAVANAGSAALSRGVTAWQAYAFVIEGAWE